MRLELKHHLLVRAGVPRWERAPAWLKEQAHYLTRKLRRSTSNKYDYASDQICTVFNVEDVPTLMENLELFEQGSSHYRARVKARFEEATGEPFEEAAGDFEAALARKGTFEEDKAAYEEEEEDDDDEENFEEDELGEDMYDLGLGEDDDDDESNHAASSSAAAAGKKKAKATATLTHTPAVGAAEFAQLREEVQAIRTGFEVNEQTSAARHTEIMEAVGRVIGLVRSLHEEHRLFFFVFCVVAAWIAFEVYEYKLDSAANAGVIAEIKRFLTAETLPKKVLRGLKGLFE